MEEDYDSAAVENVYSFGVSGNMIWLAHICIGLFLAYLGYNIYNQQEINGNVGVALVVLGVMAMFYHLHLWYLNTY